MKKKKQGLVKSLSHAILNLIAGLGIVLFGNVAFSKDMHLTPSPVSSGELIHHIEVLSSDEFEGRSPGTKGEALTVQYIIDQFKKIGLTGGRPNGDFVQSVPLVGIVSKPSLHFKAKNKSWSLKFPDDFVGMSPLLREKIEISNSDLVFVGYGVVAPEYGWDDYKGVDLHGKTIVMLINDPAIPDPKDPSRLDPKMFKGEEMTYYGRWTYKYEMAVKLGAVAAIIIHETKAAAYPYEVVKNSWGRENFIIQSDEPSPDFPQFASWIQQDRAKELFEAAGYDFESLKKAALSKDFKPINLGVTTDIEVKNSWKKLESQNVVAQIEGSDKKLKSEWVIYSAHWDHFGIDEKLPGPKANQIFHGARDNASGVASLIEIARAYKNLPSRPLRSVLFLATTAEERGLLGARYYVQHPLYPLAKTLLDINMDLMNTWGKTQDFQITGYGKSSVDEMVEQQARRQGRKVVQESRPELGTFYRADHFEFAKKGVPVLYSKGGNQFVSKSQSFGREKSDDYIAHDYHKTSDVISPSWDMSGDIQDTELLFAVGYAFTKSKKFPLWKSGSEFKSMREP